MKLLVTLVGVLAAVEVYFATTGHLGLNTGIGLLLAAPSAGLWVDRELVRKGFPLADNRLRATRVLIFAYECFILGSANALAAPHIHADVATAGAAILICVQSFIFLLVFRNPRIVKPVERPASLKNLSARMTIAMCFYIALIITACAIFVPRSSRVMVQTIPVELRWPGIALLYAAFGCLALALACEHTKGSNALYVAVVIVSASSVGMEFVGRRNWYFLALSLLSFLLLIPGWPGAVVREGAPVLGDQVGSG